MTGKAHKVFGNSTKSCICKKVYEEGEVKVNVHNHINGKYRRSAYQEYSRI